MKQVEDIDRGLSMGKGYSTGKSERVNEWNVKMRIMDIASPRTQINLTNVVVSRNGMDFC